MFFFQSLTCFSSNWIRLNVFIIGFFYFITYFYNLNLLQMNLFVTLLEENVPTDTLKAAGSFWQLNFE